MKKLLKRLIGNAVRKVGWAFLAGFCAGGAYTMYLWRQIVGRVETRRILNDPELMASIERAEEDIRAGRIVTYEDADALIADLHEEADSE